MLQQSPQPAPGPGLVMVIGQGRLSSLMGLFLSFVLMAVIKAAIRSLYRIHDDQKELVNSC